MLRIARAAIRRIHPVSFKPLRGVQLIPHMEIQSRVGRDRPVNRVPWLRVHVPGARVPVCIHGGET